MIQVLKIGFIIMATAIAGSGVYYSQNSKNSSPSISSTTTTEEKIEKTRTELTTTNEAETPIKTVETEKKPDKTANWITYSNAGVTLKYPNDGTYTVEESTFNPNEERFVITQEHPGNRIHVSKANETSVLYGNEKNKIINNNSYKVFYREGMGDGYGYVIAKNGQFYTFESVWGAENEIFELIMTTVEF